MAYPQSYDKKSPSGRSDFKKLIADEFLNTIDSEDYAWRKQWHGIGGYPYNGVTNRKYQGLNVFYLSIVAMVNGYSDPRWMTFNQIADKNGYYHKGQKWHLKKGSKAVYVEYWHPRDLKNKKNITWEQYKNELANGRDSTEFTIYPFYTAVYNAEQVEGIPPIEIETHDNIKPDVVIDKLSKNMGVPIFNDGGDRAYYSPMNDEIHLPLVEVFESSHAYNSTALHELAHSTGHKSRLNRDIKNTFGSEKYAYEELVAELSSCFMSVNLEEEISQAHIDNHKGYVQSWRESIENDPDVLIKAIKEAENTANYMEWKAEILTKEDYEKLCDNQLLVPKAQVTEAVKTRPINQNIVPVEKTEMPVSMWEPEQKSVYRQIAEKEKEAATLNREAEHAKSEPVKDEM